MRFASRLLVLLSALTFLVCTPSTAQQAGRIKLIKLLTADVGWAATDRSVFWTTNGGTNWRDITPRLDHKRQMVSSVFFLNASTGWVLLGCGDDRDAFADDVCFELASTSDAGQTWDLVRPKIVDPVPHSAITQDRIGFSGVTYLDFSSAMSGWVILKKNLPVGRSSGVMLRTVDGGKTWTQLPNDALPMAENLRFVNATNGWMAGGPDMSLFSTHDAGMSWQHVELPTPKEIPAGLSPVYDLPTFVDEKTGYLPVSYASSESTSVPLVLFKTEDSGKTWRPSISLPPVPNTHAWLPHPCAVVNGELMHATISERIVRRARKLVPNPNPSRPEFRLTHPQ